MVQKIGKSYFFVKTMSFFIFSFDISASFLVNGSLKSEDNTARFPSFIFSSHRELEEHLWKFRELSSWKFDLVAYQNAIRLHFTFPTTWFIGSHREWNRPLNINFHNPSLYFGKQTCLVAKPLWTTFECLLACLQFFFKMSDLPSTLLYSVSPNHTNL